MAIRKYLYTVLVAFFIAAPTLAQPGPADRMDQRLEVLDSRLDLTDEQESQIRQIWSDHRQEMEAWLSENEDATREERRAHFRGRVDEVQGAVKALLTPEQAATYAEFQQRRGDRIADRRDRPRQGSGMRGSQDGRRGGKGVRGNRDGRRGGHEMDGRHDSKRGERGMQGAREGRRGDGAVQGRGMRPGADMFMSRIAEELELSDDQRNELREIVESHHAEGTAWREAHPEATREQIRAYHEGHFAQLKAELGEILTPEQIQKFEELHETRRDRMQNRRTRN